MPSPQIGLFYHIIRSFLGNFFLVAVAEKVVPTKASLKFLMLVFKAFVLDLFLFLVDIEVLLERHLIPLIRIGLKARHSAHFELQNGLIGEFIVA